MGLLGKQPIGAWELTLADTPEMRKRFKDGDVDDLALVPTCAGRTPVWPGPERPRPTCARTIMSVEH